MSFIISRGYAEAQILKTSESDPLSFWNILICTCPNSEKKVKLKRTLHVYTCKKKKSADTLRYHIFVCNIGSAKIYIFVCNISKDKIYLIFVCNKCSNITLFLYYKNF